MANKKEPKYNKGDKFTIEIAEIHTHYDDNNKPYNVYRVKGFNSLFLDEYALDKLVPEWKDVYKEQPIENKSLNTRFVVTETDRKNLTVGKIYKVVNGKFVSDDDWILPIGAKIIRTVEELKDYLDEAKGFMRGFGGTTKIIEIKE